MIFSTIDEIIASGKKYSIIYEDPSWSYNDKALAGQRGAGCKYETMTTEQLCLMEINKILNDDAICFMWVTFPKLLDGTCMKVMIAHGFMPKTCAFNWIKYYKNSKPFIGMGNWTRANSEICILGTRGKPKRINAGIRQLIETTDRENYMPDIVQTVPERHSKKPDLVRDRIVQLCGDLPRIELFSRQEVEGWDCFGNQVQPISKP